MSIGLREYAVIATVAGAVAGFERFGEATRSLVGQARVRFERRRAAVDLIGLGVLVWVCVTVAPALSVAEASVIVVGTVLLLVMRRTDAASSTRAVPRHLSDEGARK